MYDSVPRWLPLGQCIISHIAYKHYFDYVDTGSTWGQSKFNCYTITILIQ